MKPSERIRELGEREYKEKGVPVISYDLVYGIMAYLDEQYEAQLSLEEALKELSKEEDKPLSKELCTKGGNVACTCESCVKEFMKKVNLL
jgi:hypothetical protein